VRIVSLAFLITALVVVATPGTGVLFTISAGLSRGARASAVAALGCTLGIVPHLAAAITRTAALLRTSGTAFEIVKFLGVAYLLCLAWVAWRDKTPLVIADRGTEPSAWRVITSAILANLLNPKRQFSSSRSCRSLFRAAHRIRSAACLGSAPCSWA
jgi:threonine/homoserine/homoserine lactone efflux protein